MPKSQIIKKEINDKFYTSPEIAELCFSDLLSLGLPTDLYVEPSAGNGSFYNLLPEGSIGIDIEPELDGLIKLDYFKFKAPDNINNVTIIGNPPFGERNNLTRRFIKKASTESSTIAFVLPEVFSKPVVQKVFPESFKLIFERELPPNSFLLNGTPYNVYSVFQVWTSLETSFPDLRKKYTIPTGTADFIFSNKDNSDFFVFGSAPKKCILPDLVNDKNRGYYIKLSDNVLAENVIRVFQSSNWKEFGKSSVNGGVFWLTKQELINGYEILKAAMSNNSV